MMVLGEGRLGWIEERVSSGFRIRVRDRKEPNQKNSAKKRQSTPARKPEATPKKSKNCKPDQDHQTAKRLDKRLEQLGQHKK